MAGKTDSAKPFARFKELVRKLISVPKKEVAEKERELKRLKKRQRRRSA